MLQFLRIVLPVVSSSRLLAAFILFGHIVGQNPSNLRGASEPPLVQVLVFDAGSSGTRIHVFNMHMAVGAAVPTIDLDVREKQTLKVKPGLSHFARNDDLLGCQRNIQSLLEFADQFVPLDQRPSTPAILKATAGLRAVGAEKAESVLAKVRETLRSSLYRFEDDWAAVIKGKEEAGLAWVAANYLRGTFSRSSERSAKSLGVIEMGGGSTQVTFEVDQSDTVADQDNFRFLTALGQTYVLYAHSYLGFGQDYAQGKLRESVSANSSGDPCYPQGYVRKVSESADASVVKGLGDAAQCRTRIQEILFKTDAAPGQYPFELPLRGAFVATENFFYVRKDLSLNIGKLDATGTEALGACSTQVALTQEELAARLAGKLDSGKPNQCFALSYQMEMLNALKAFGQPGVEVEVKRQINGGDIDWALGAALMHFLDSLTKSRQTRIDGEFSLGGSPMAFALLAAVLLFATALRLLCGRSQRFFQVPKDSDNEAADCVKPSKLGTAVSVETVL